MIRLSDAMKFTDLFIRRPVLASVVSLVILVVGLRSFSSLQVLAYPKTENGVVTISTSLPGADPDSIAGFITTPLETAVAQANGIDYMASTARAARARSPCTCARTTTPRRRGRDQHQGQLGVEPAAGGIAAAHITVKVGQTIDAMFLGFTSDTLASIRSRTI